MANSDLSQPASEGCPNFGVISRPESGPFLPAGRCQQNCFDLQRFGQAVEWGSQCEKPAFRVITGISLDYSLNRMPIDDGGQAFPTAQRIPASPLRVPALPRLES